MSKPLSEILKEAKEDMELKERQALLELKQGRARLKLDLREGPTNQKELQAEIQELSKKLFNLDPHQPQNHEKIKKLHEHIELNKKVVEMYQTPTKNTTLLQKLDKVTQQVRKKMPRIPRSPRASSPAGRSR